MSYIFNKLFVGAFAAIKQKFALRKLVTKKIVLPPLEMTDGKLDTSTWGLPPGAYRITVVACAEGIKDSVHSNEIILKIK